MSRGIGRLTHKITQGLNLGHSLAFPGLQYFQFSKSLNLMITRSFHHPKLLTLTHLRKAQVTKVGTLPGMFFDLGNFKRCHKLCPLT